MADIAINPVTRRVQFTGNTGTGPFAFTFNILADEDIAVYKNTTLLTLTTHYSVTTNANGTGSITLVSGQALISSDVLTIIGGRDLSRTTDFVTAGDLLASSLNEQLDSLVIMTQQLDEKVGRTIKTNPGDVYTDLELPTKDNRKGTVLGFNATSGDPEVGPTIADVSSLASITADIATLADIEDGTDATDAIQTVAGISANVTTVAGISSNITTVAGNTSNINAVAADATDIGTVAGSISNVNTVAGIDSNITTVAGNTTNINTVAGISSNVTTVAGISANVTTVAGISSDVTTVAGISSDVTTVAADGTDIGTVATNIADVNTVASNIATISAKVSKSGDTMTGDLTIQGNLTVSGTTITVDSATAQTIDLGDNDKIRLGDGDDLQIYHDGSNSYVEDTATGNLYLKTNGTNIAMFGGTEIMAVFAKDDAVSLYHNGSSKLATTSTGIDVTGTVTADGLALGGNILRDVDNNSMFISGGNAASTGANIGLYGSTSGNPNDILLRRNNVKFAAFDGATGDISFYEDTGTTAKFFWDASAESLGIGTSSPISALDVRGEAVVGSGTDGVKLTYSAGNSTGIIDTGFTSTGLEFRTGNSFAAKIDSSGNVGIGTTSPLQALHVSSGTGNSAAIFESTDATSQIWLKDSASSSTYQTGIACYGDNLLLNNGGERMRIDSSGNLLVGKTSTSFSTAGFRASPSGFIQLVANGSSTANFNRLTSDGDIVDFRKDGTTVGSIGSYGSGSGMFLGTGDTGIAFNSTDDNVFPRNPSTNLPRDNAIDLGSSTARFKDLYLSSTLDIDASAGARIKLTDTGTQAYSIGNTGTSFNIYNESQASEAMRIDSSGNLLVGKTAPNIGVAGAEIKPNGNFASTANGDWAALFNRLTSDGDIVQFRKDGTTVGSIEVADGDNLVIASTVTDHAGFKFSDTTVTPWVNNANSDNAMDIGAGANRFKDLYLSGGVYLGGTGAANKLDDYESGSVTLTMGGGTSNPSTTQSTTGQYIKVGSLVTVWFKFSNKDNSGASGTVEIDGLPFTVTSLLDGYGTAWGGRDSAGGTGHKVYLAGNGTTSAKMIDGSGNNVTWSSTGSGTYQGGMIIYRT